MEAVTQHTLQKEVPFDQYNRQVQVKSVLKSLRTNSQKQLKILDVGGYKGRTADFLSQDNVTVLDVFDVEEDGYVKGTALDMPFDDESFDFVVSYDVLEHIPNDMRKKFVAECGRVAKRGFIICAPHNNVANALAEDSLNNYFHRLHHKPHPWLKEHIEYGLPDFDKVEQFAKSNGFLTSILTSNKTQLWLAMQQAIFLNSKYPMAAEKLMEVNEIYNTHASYDRGISRKEAYRLILCCVKEAKDHITVEMLVKERQEDPLKPSHEIELFSAIAEYNRTILQKTATLSAQYKKLHAFEKNRANMLHKENENLHHKVEAYEMKLGAKLVSKVRNHWPPQKAN